MGLQTTIGTCTMTRLLFAPLLLVLWATSGDAIVCYECSFQYSAVSGVANGTVECGDASWGLGPTDESFIAIDCRSCYKEFWDLGADRFEIRRGCSSGLVPPINGVTAWDRQQKTDTCYTTPLKAGDFSRCACSTDLCNAEAACDRDIGCFENDFCPPLGECEDGCSGSLGLHASVLSALVAALTALANCS